MSFVDEGYVIQKYKESGDLSFLGDLYAPYMPLVYGVCLKYLKSPEASEDAVMSIFEQLIDKLKVHEVKNFKSWLYTLSKNYCLMEIRKNKGIQHLDFEDISEKDLLNDEVSSDTSEFKNIQDIEWQLEHNFNKLKGCLNKLTFEQKTCIELFYLQKKCYKSITEITSFDMKQVKSYIQNGKRNLKICLERAGYEK